MTLLNAIEIVQQEHPEIPVPVIAQYVKAGYRDFAVQSKYVRQITAEPALTLVENKNVGAWSMKYQIPFSEIALPEYEPVGLRVFTYDGTRLHSVDSSEGSFVRYRQRHGVPTIDIVTQPFVGALDASLIQLETFGYDPRIINSTSYVEDFGLNNLEFDMYAVNNAMKHFNLRKNLTVQASYYERENRNILLRAKKEISLSSSWPSNIQVTL